MPLREKHSDIGEMTECFDNMSLWKILVLFWELQQPNLRFRFTVVVVKSRRLFGD